jgi:hypothetical protein
MTVGYSFFIIAYLLRQNVRTAVLFLQRFQLLDGHSLVEQPLDAVQQPVQIRVEARLGKGFEQQVDACRLLLGQGQKRVHQKRLYILFLRLPAPFCLKSKPPPE